MCAAHPVPATGAEICGTGAQGAVACLDNRWSVFIARTTVRHLISHFQGGFRHRAFSVIRP